MKAGPVGTGTWTPLQLAVNAKKIDNVRTLLKNGANLAFTHNLIPPLLMAARSGYNDILKVLLDHGADIEACDNKGWTALLCAAKQGKTACVATLLDYGANKDHVSKDQHSALTLACADKHFDILLALLFSGITIDSTWLKKQFPEIQTFVANEKPMCKQVFSVHLHLVLEALKANMPVEPLAQLIGEYAQPSIEELISNKKILFSQLKAQWRESHEIPQLTSRVRSLRL